MSAQAKIVLDDHYTTGEKEYSFEEVCRTLTHRDSPLIEKESSISLDCMGEVVNPIEFCHQREIYNPYLSRAVIRDDKVICKSAKRVIVKWKCEGESDQYCKDKEVGCFLFKEILARRLKVAHQALDDGHLSCYFDTQANAILLNI